MNSNILFSLRNKQSCLFLNKESTLKQSLERTLFLFRTSRIPLLVSAKGDIIFARPYGGIQGVRWAAGHMGPALHGIFVGQGTRALPWVRYGIGGRTGASAPTEGLPIGFRRGRCPLQEVRCKEESPSHGFAVPAPFRQGGQGDGGCGLPQPVCALASQ